MKLLLIFFILFSSCLADSDLWFRYVAMPVTAAAYSDDPNQCWSMMQQYTHGFPNISYSIYRQYNVKCESLNDTCSAYIAIRNYTALNQVSIYVVFRGTSNNYAFFENGWDYDEMVPFVTGGKVSKVFFDGFNSIWNAGMRDDLFTLKNKYTKQFTFFGHSIGGAMALLAATTLNTVDSKTVVKLYTFGQPRTGDSAFANFYDMSVDISPIRIIHKADIVPHLPPFNTTLNYYHLPSEYWYNSDMGTDDTYVMCTSYDGEDPKCSNSLNSSDYNMEDHKNYFGRDFIEYGKSGCPDLKTAQIPNWRIF